MDLALFATTLAILIHVVLKGFFRSSPMPGLGVALVAGGIFGIQAMLLAEDIRFFELSALRGSALYTGWNNVGPREWFLWATMRVSVLVFLAGVLLVIKRGHASEAATALSKNSARRVDASVARTETQFSDLFESTSDSVYCFEFNPPVPTNLPIAEQIKYSHDAVLATCNLPFVEEIRKSNVVAALGMRMGELQLNKDTASYEEFYRQFIDNGYQLSDHELHYSTPEGEDRAVRVSVKGSVVDGMLMNIWGSQKSMLESQTSDVAPRSTTEQQDLLGDISMSLVMATDENSGRAVNESLKKLCRHVGASRASLVWIDWTVGKAQVAYVHCEDGNLTRRNIELYDYPDLAARVLQGRSVSISDVRRAGRDFVTECESLAKLGITSFAAIPLMIAGEVVGALTFSCTYGARDWSARELANLRTVANVLANFVLHLKAFGTLDEALGRLKLATERMDSAFVHVREEFRPSHGFEEIIGESAAMSSCLAKVAQVAGSDTAVLVQGETGTGKELIARAIHARSKRASRPLITVNCAALPGSLIESELFGHEKGAFTGAHASKKGRFDLADKGTLFLDEIGELPMDIQAKLLRVLQEGEFQRVGGSETIVVDVRIIAATNRGLRKAVEQNEFRADLFYRVNTFPILVPPLRERDGDVRLLTEYFVHHHAKRIGRSIKAITPDMIHQLCRYRWPGNVRELESVVQRSLLLTTSPVLDLAEPIQDEQEADAGRLSGSEREPPRVISSTVSELRLVEKEHIISVLDETQWKISGPRGAATKLGIPPSTLRSKMKKLSIARSDR